MLTWTWVPAALARKQKHTLTSFSLWSSTTTTVIAAQTRTDGEFPCVCRSSFKSLIVKVNTTLAYAEHYTSVPLHNIKPPVISVYQFLVTVWLKQQSLTCIYFSHQLCGYSEERRTKWASLTSFSLMTWGQNVCFPVCLSEWERKRADGEKADNNLLVVSALWNEMCTSAYYQSADFLIESFLTHWPHMKYNWTLPGLQVGNPNSVCSSFSNRFILINDECVATLKSSSR